MEKEFIDRIDDLWQLYTLGIWYNAESSLWILRFIYIHRNDRLLDMRDDADYDYFLNFMDHTHRNVISVMVSTSPVPRDIKPWNTNIYHNYIYQEDIDNNPHFHCHHVATID